jgi:biotin carboxyl carrier protein
MKRLQISLGTKAFDTETSRDEPNSGLTVRVRSAAVEVERRVRILRGGPDALLLVDDRLVSLRLAAASGSRNRAFVSQGALRQAAFGALGAPKTSEVEGASNAALTSPMPGRVIQVAVQAGELVEKGQLLLVIEAMKMQNELYSPTSARVRSVLVNAGDTLERGALLLEFD